MNKHTPPLKDGHFQCEFIKNSLSITKNEEGFVLVLAMLIMVVLVVIGITSVKGSRFELLIAGSEKQHKKTFYTAESGWQRGIQWLENRSSPPTLRNPALNDTVVDGNVTATIANGSAGNVTYTYDIEMVELTGADRKVPGASGSRGWRKFRYTIDSSATGADTSSRVVVVAEKPFDTE